MLRHIIILVVFLSISRSELEIGQSYGVTASYANGAALELPAGWTIEDEQVTGDTTTWHVRVGASARRGVVQIRAGDAEINARVNGPPWVYLPIMAR